MTTPIVFLDTETTSLRHDRRAWEIAAIARRPGALADVSHTWFIDADDLDLGNADIMSLKIGQFYERHPQYQADREPDFTDIEDEADTLRMVEAVTRGAHLVGAVISFDADVLGQRMRAHGICPSWHYHLVDVEALAAGRLGIPPPWDSEELSKLAGVDPGQFDRHTALGDALWAKEIYDAILSHPGGTT